MRVLQNRCVDKMLNVPTSIEKTMPEPEHIGNISEKWYLLAGCQAIMQDLNSLQRSPDDLAVTNIYENDGSRMIKKVRMCYLCVVLFHYTTVMQLRWV